MPTRSANGPTIHSFTPNAACKPAGASSRFSRLTISTGAKFCCALQPRRLTGAQRRGAGGTEQTSQVSPPADFRIADGLQDQDVDEQALYVPRPLPSRLLRLTALGGTLDLEAPFVPPAPLRAKNNNVNVFDAYSLERVRILIALGREVTTEVVMGAFYPLGFRAALLKVTERQYLPWPNTYDADAIGWRGPLAFEVQRFFIQVANPEKVYPGVGQPFSGRGWPTRALTMLTQRTPDLLDPTRSTDRTDRDLWTEELNGRLNQRLRSGLVFWPRTGPGERGNVRFRFAVDRRPEPVSMPLIFVDNQAAHDGPTMREPQRYWNVPRHGRQPPAVSASPDGASRTLARAAASTTLVPRAATPKRTPAATPLLKPYLGARVDTRSHVATLFPAAQREAGSAANRPPSSRR